MEFGCQAFGEYADLMDVFTDFHDSQTLLIFVQVLNTEDGVG